MVEEDFLIIISLRRASGVPLLINPKKLQHRSDINFVQTQLIAILLRPIIVIVTKFYDYLECEGTDFCHRFHPSWNIVSDTSALRGHTDARRDGHSCDSAAKPTGTPVMYRL